MARPAQIEARLSVLIDVAVSPAGIFALHFTASHSLERASVPFASDVSEHDDLAIFELDTINLHASFNHAFYGLRTGLEISGYKAKGSTAANPVVGWPHGALCESANSPDCPALVIPIGRGFS